MVQWFALYFQTILIISLCDQNFDLKINIRHSTLYFTVRCFASYLWNIFHVKTPQLSIILQYHPTIDLKLKGGLEIPLFHSLVSNLISRSIFVVFTLYFWIMSPYDSNFDFKINMSNWSISHSPVSCLNSRRIFHLWTSYFSIMSQ